MRAFNREEKFRRVTPEKFCAGEEGRRQRGMKISPWSMLAVTLAATVAAAAAEEGFSKTVQPADFSAAGLTKLSPEELGRLDALVRDFKSGALEVARREAAAASAARADAEKRAAKAEAQARVIETETKKANPSLIAKTKVLLTPGTQIEYATVESRIVGDFRGWEGRTLFTLENGQRWQAVGSDVYAGPPIPNPAVKIVPGMLGAYWMSIEGINRRVKVTLVGGK
jgi:hypothetical protein